MRVDGRGLRQLTRGAFDSAPTWSVRGVIAFARQTPDGDATGDIYTVRPDGSGIRRITRNGETDPHAKQPDFSPDGRRLAFVRDTGSVSNIYVMSARGGRARRLTRDGFSGHPAWSPDGRFLAGDDSRGIFVIGANGRGRHAIHPRNSLDQPSWQPVGRR